PGRLFRRPGRGAPQQFVVALAEAEDPPAMGAGCQAAVRRRGGEHGGRRGKHGGPGQSRHPRSGWRGAFGGRQHQARPRASRPEPARPFVVLSAERSARGGAPRFEEGSMSLATLLLIVLIVLLIGAIPSWPYSRRWGYYPSGLLGVVVIVVLILALSGRI